MLPIPTRARPGAPAAARLWRLLLHPTLLAIAITSAWSAPQARAQVVETPIAFDSDGRVLVMTPALQERLGLVPELLPVPSTYREARLYATAGGGYVVSSLLHDGSLSRAPLTAAGQAALRRAIDAALAGARHPVSMDDPTMISEPVRDPFVINQTALGLLLYGPAAATLVGEPLGSTAAYLGVAGGSFFWSYGLSRSATITRAQNHLAWHFARRGAGVAMAATYAASETDEPRAYAAAALVGSIGGTIVGARLGRPYTDGEAHAMTLGSTLATVGTIGTLAALGRVDDAEDARLETALGTAAAVAGLPLGLRYARRAAYTITAGDVGTMVTTGLIGAGTALTAVGIDGVDANLAIAGTAAGALAGAFVGDRLLVRRFDHTVSQSNVLRVGAAAGALLGLAISVPIEFDDERPVIGLATAGAALGTLATHSLMAPHRAIERGSAPRAPVPSRNESRNDAARRGFDWTLNLDAAALAAAGTPGQHSVLRITF